MNKSPKVSIITPLFNRADLVKQTIESVCRQTYYNWELLVVDDGSTDGSFSLVEEFAKKDQRIKLFRRERMPKGAPTCRNIGIEKSQGEYIIFLDSDDLLASHCLQQRVKCFTDNPNFDFLVFPVQYFKDTPGDMSKIFLRFFYQDYLTSFLLQSHWITVSPIWKKQAVRDIGGFDEDLICMQDGELHIRALTLGLKFKIFSDTKFIDSYLRRSDNYERITNRVNTRKLEGMVNANLKMFSHLENHNQLTNLRKTMLAAQFLNISWNLELLGEHYKALSTWQITLDKGMVSSRSFKIGKSFIQVRSYVLFRNSRIAAGILKRMYQLFLPKFLLWP